MLFYYYDISDNFGKYLGHWLKKADTLKPVYDLYFGSYYIPSMYAEEEFLTLTRALEAYYRRVHNGRLKFGPTIDAILDQVLNAYKDIVQSIVKDQPYFVTRVTNTRNYLTHHNKKSPANTIKNPSELPDYSQKLRLILQLCFFVEMEFSTDIVETITSRNEMFKQHVR
jgi:hypothetical protein